MLREDGVKATDLDRNRTDCDVLFLLIVREQCRVLVFDSKRRKGFIGQRLAQIGRAVSIGNEERYVVCIFVATSVLQYVVAKRTMQRTEVWIGFDRDNTPIAGTVACTDGQVVRPRRPNLDNYARALVAKKCVVDD